MVVDGDVEELPARARRVVALVAGDAMAGAHDAGELLDVEMNEFTGVSALVATDRQRRFEGRESGRLTAQETGHRALESLAARAIWKAWRLAPAQGQHADDARRVEGSWGRLGSRRAVVEARKPFCAEAGEPLEDGAGGDAKSRGDGGHGLLKIPDAVDDLRSLLRRAIRIAVQLPCYLDI